MTQAYTAETAKRFEHGASIPHILILEQEAQARGCTCEAYVDWFTYRRWQAQGFQVQRGEKGVKLTTFKPVEKVDEKGKTVTSSVPRTTTVFCRCQVKPKGEA